MNSPIYITGANGFIGRRVVERLSRKNKIVALLRPGSIPGFGLNENIEIIYGDLTDRESLEISVPRGAIIVNLAANPYHPQLSYEVNVNGTSNLIEVAKQKKVKLIVHISSQATKIKKQGVYAKTKNQSDRIVKNGKIPYVILKPSLVYGEGERGLFSKIRQLAKMLPMVPIFGDGRTNIYPIYVDDFAEIVARVINNPKTYQNVFDVGTLSPVTYIALYRELAPKVIHVPVWIGLTLAKAVSFLPNPPIYRDNVLGSTQNTHCQPKPILKLLKFRPRNFSEGMEKIKGGNKLKIAVVGLGKMGTLHMSILNTFSEVEIVALIDTNISLYNTVKSMGIAGNFYTSLESACKDREIDAVYIITPTFTHLDLIKTAIKYNLHIFVEKPVTMNDDELAQLHKIKSNKIIHTGYTLLNNRAYSEVARIIESKTYGKVLGFTGRFEHGEVFGPKKGWMFNKRLSGGGVLMNPGPHFFSLLKLFFGQPKRIEGVIKNIYTAEMDDEVKAELRYGDFKGKIFLSWSMAGRDLAQNIFEIRLEKATIKTDGNEIIIKKTKSISKIRLSHIDPKMKSIFNLNPKANGEAYYIENRNFIDAILGDKKIVPNDLKTALQIESVIFECYKHCTVVKEVA